MKAGCDKFCGCGACSTSWLWLACSRNCLVLAPACLFCVMIRAQLDYLNAASDNSEVSHDTLISAGAMTKTKSRLVKVVGGGELARKGLVVKAHAFTESARQAITGNGGQCIVIPSYTVSEKKEEAPVE